jgi:hypothetical protein
MITVTVKDPTGQYPIPNVAVFPETGALPPITTGSSTCPTVPPVARTGANGTIGITAAAGAQVVAQIGKWRVAQPVPAGCHATSMTLKLPGSSAAGSVPAIAISTGNADTLECTLHRMGIDGAVTVFQGAGGATATGAKPSSSLWAAGGMLPYDAVLLSCEGAATAGASPANLATYAQGGGMVYAEHWQYSVFNAAPFMTQNIATWTTGANFLTGTTNAVIQTTAAGAGLQQWLPAGTLVNSELPMLNTEAAHNATLGTASSLELAADANASVPNAPLLFSWSEGGVGTAGGRIVYADFHVGSSSADYGTTAGATTVPAGATYPSGCASETALKPSELVFLYTLFDGLSCGN